MVAALILELWRVVRSMEEYRRERAALDAEERFLDELALKP